MGRLRFLLMYLGTGVIATLSFALLAGNSMTPLVGASGAISGVLGCYFYMFPKNKVKVFILLFPIFINVIKIPARIVLTIYVVVDNLLPVLVQAGGNVAYGAHLGGFFAGLAIAVSGEYFGWRSPFSRSGRVYASLAGKKEQKRNMSSATFSEKLKVAIASPGYNLLEILSHGRTEDFRSLSVEQILEVAEKLKENGLFEPAVRLLKVGASVHKRSPQLSRIYYELGDSRLQQGFPTAAYQHFLTALDLGADEKTESLIRIKLKGIRI